MPDREKVINYLQSEIKRAEKSVNDIWLECVEVKLLRDALALLKEQEAVKPTFKQDEKGIFVWCCGSCGAYMYHIYDGIDKAKEYAKFCRQCGQAVKWDG